jgi:protoporphyrinogen oxidase
MKKNVVVLGAGVTGLSAAYRLSKSGNFNVHVVDKELHLGGVCRSFTDGEFILDHGPHKFYTLLDGILDELKSVMGDELLERDKSQTIYLRGRYYQFPLKISEMVLHFPPLTSAQLIASFGQQAIRNRVAPKEAKTYEDFVVERFGRKLYQEVFEPMTRKVYGSPEMLDRKLAEVRISSPGLIAVIKQALMPKEDRSVSAPVFHYPKQGYGRIPARLAEVAKKNGAQFHLGAKLRKIEMQDGKPVSVIYESKSGETVRLPCDEIVYTIPISALDKLIVGQLPDSIRRAIQSISYRHSIIYYFLLKGRDILPSMWAFFPEEKFRFGRLSEMVKFSPETAPPGQTALMVDFTCESDDPYWSMNDDQMGEVLRTQMEPLKLFSKGDVLRTFSKRFTNFYPTYALGYGENLKAVRELESMYKNFYFIGRLGDFNYNNADQCLDMGFRVADHIGKNGATPEEWHLTRSQTFDNYRIVD